MQFLCFSLHGRLPKSTFGWAVSMKIPRSQTIACFSLRGRLPESTFWWAVSIHTASRFHFLVGRHHCKSPLSGVTVLVVSGASLLHFCSGVHAWGDPFGGIYSLRRCRGVPKMRIPRARFGRAPLLRFCMGSKNGVTLLGVFLPPSSFFVQ